LHVASTFSLETQNYFESQLSHLKDEEYKTLIHIAKQEKVVDTCADVLENYGFIEKVDGNYQILGQAFGDYLYHRSKNENQVS